MAFNKTVTARGGNWFKTQFLYEQPRPYKAPLPYHTYGARTNVEVAGTGEFVDPALDMIQGNAADYSAEAKEAAAAAYDKIIGRIKVDASAMLAVNVAERKQSFSMIADRALQLGRSLRALRRFDLPGALTELGFSLKLKSRKGPAWVRVGKNRTHSIPKTKVDRDSYYLRRKSKKVGSLWLEYHFGWSPLLSDINGAIDVLQDRQFRQRSTASATASRDYSLSQNEPWYYQSRWWASNKQVRCTFGCRYHCSFLTSSPNAEKASQLGLVNPATIAWELIPFSFLVDWFIPVGRFLDSYTDLVGITVHSIQRSERRTSTYMMFETSPWGKTDQRSAGYMFRRSLLGSLPIPGLMDRSGNGIAGLSRAATAISLLTGFLKTSKWS